jgi:hypothetical protein
MPKKVSKDKKPHKKDQKTQIPPDAFDDDAGTKVLIAKSDEITPEKQEEVEAKDTPQTSKMDADKSSEKEMSVDDDAEDKVEFKDDADKNSDDEGTDSEDNKSSNKDESEKEDEKRDGDDEESDDDLDEEKLPSSFYEKVLGEKLPEKSEEEEVIEEEKAGINRSMFFLGGVVFILTIIITSGVGYFVLQSYQPQPQQQVVDEVPTETPTPTPVEIDKEGITFEVLNGSGQSGVAGKTADAIKDLGYTADEVGNADSSDYSGITVGFSEDVTKDMKKVILDDLKKEFLRADEDNDLTPDGTDVVVIVGK